MLPWQLFGSRREFNDRSRDGFWILVYVLMFMYLTFWGALRGNLALVLLWDSILAYYSYYCDQISRTNNYICKCAILYATLHPASITLWCVKLWFWFLEVWYLQLWSLFLDLLSEETAKVLYNFGMWLWYHGLCQSIPSSDTIMVPAQYFQL